MEKQWKKITTFTQLLFYLEQGEIAVWELSDADCYLIKEKKYYKIIIQPKLGSSKEYIHKDKKKVEKFFNDLRRMEIDLWVLPGGKLDSKKLTIIERTIDFFRDKKEGL